MLNTIYYCSLSSSGSSKSSCLTRSTYLSTEREDLNVLYVEQEIQEARDKGIVDFYEISYGRLTIGNIYIISLMATSETKQKILTSYIFYFIIIALLPI